jgi:hypothetical protein
MESNHSVCVQNEQTRDEVDTDFGTFTNALEHIRQQLPNIRFIRFEATCHAFVNGNDTSVMRWLVKVPSPFYNTLRDALVVSAGRKLLVGGDNAIQ